MLRIALAQINTTVGDFKGNCQKIEEYILRARSFGVDVIVFPELSISGYPPEDLLLKRHFIAENKNFLQKITKNVANIVAIIGFVDNDKEGHLFNAAAVVYNKRVKSVYRKKELPNYGVFDEKRYFISGQLQQNIYLLKNIPFGISICEDIWESKGPCLGQAKQGAKVLINISSSPYHTGKQIEREKLLKQRAKEYKTFICYTNLVGGQDELVFDGASVIVNPQGKVIASGQPFKEDLVVADITVNEKIRYSNKNIIVLNKIKEKDARLPVKGKIVAALESVEEIYQALVLGTRDYVKKNGFHKVVIGLSGGIDSSLVACIAVDAIGKENVIGISMPSVYSSQETQADAKKLADNLGIKFIEIPIQKIFDIYLSEFKDVFSGLSPDVTEENLQARIRGNILMAFSNKFGWLVLTTGNKSEIAVGYCTLYGDMSGGFAVIKDVPKIKVYALAKFINERFEKIIPLTVLKRPPTAELRENQKDEDSLPPYSILDNILKKYVEDHESIVNLQKKFDINIIKDVIHKVDLSEYKRRQAPPGIKITPRAFGKDWRLPITNKYKGF